MRRGLNWVTGRIHQLVRGGRRERGASDRNTEASGNGVIVERRGAAGHSKSSSHHIRTHNCAQQM